ncbi:MAG TPA: type I-C CRISPR-associated endonuclease Cas1c [Thermoanaerobaculaceae bacterium]|nr:type I-C CRISPR-associated endonuclease Cas1c [Thermoanaerobaculaceae bacterium]HRS15475.1 type I-C CRISPR-associated endonuclease Cas1c [Thermoanaerobaculaceae bacterium]
MKRHHNTLYVTTQGAHLASEGETVVVRVEQEDRLRLPVHLLEGIVCFGRVSASPQLMAACSERGVSISFLSEHGRFLARVVGPVSGNVLLRREQYRRADAAEYSAFVAQAMVTAKVANCRTVLQRALRDHGGGAADGPVGGAVDDLARVLERLEGPMDLESVRGAEGDAARTDFAVFDHLIVAQKDAFFFRERTRRPPLDNVNALLSFVYTLLTHDARSALEAVGLDPQVGFLHRDRPGRPSLALDLIEEFRPFLADRLVLSLINRRQVQAAGFVRSETGGVTMDDDTRKAVLVAYQERKNEELKHPFLGEDTTVGMLVHLQALMLARLLRDDLDGYPAFVWR